MPSMPRPSGKNKKMAFSILGTPPNLTAKQTEKEQKVDHRLTFEETMRVK